jgi:flavin reductase (DIM6/NTAB) family NADH-FMN oxidoreductase RutF
MIAVAPEQQEDSLGNPGAKFVLNILNEGRNVRKNFDQQPRDDFGNLATKPSNNGCLMIEDALAHLECTVQSYLQSGDRTLIYAVVEQGEVSAKNGITAIQHRKSGSHY